MDADLEVLPIHKHPKYKEECCNLINEEWKRSIAARMHSLNSSSDKLPTNLILVKQSKVVGHCKISPIPTIKNSGFIESVVIDKGLRGKGYGKYLMSKTEDYCKNVLNLENIYLSTKGQELFYAKLGYNTCQPISIYGSYIPNPKIPMQSRCTSNILLKNQENGCPCPPPMPTTAHTQNSKIYMNKML